ncbi:12959_t:CDS:2, partial [Gigaspora rosea]
KTKRTNGRLLDAPRVSGVYPSENELLSPFRVERGVRQSDTLSPLLYIIAFEPLLRQLNEKVSRIPMGRYRFKLAAMRMISRLA